MRIRNTGATTEIEAGPITDDQVQVTIRVETDATGVTVELALDDAQLTMLRRELDDAHARLKADRG